MPAPRPFSEGIIRMNLTSGLRTARAFSVGAYLRALFDSQGLAEVSICLRLWPHEERPHPSFENDDALVLKDQHLAARSVFVETLADGQCAAPLPNSDVRG